MKAELQHPTRSFGQISSIEERLFSPCRRSSLIKILQADMAVEGLKWGTEADICGLVCQVLRDVVEALRLPFTITQELSLTLLRPGLHLL